MWQSQVENEQYSTESGLVRLVIEITPDFLCPFDLSSTAHAQRKNWKG